MPPQHFSMHASSGIPDKVAANNMEQDFSSSFAFSSSFDELMQDELDFLSNISPSSSPKPAISSTPVHERIQRLRQEKLAEQQGKPNKKSRLEMNISSHGDPASPSHKKSNGRKGHFKENKLLQQPILESEGRLSNRSQELWLDESVDVSSHFRDKAAEHSAELRTRKNWLLASLESASMISGLTSTGLQRSSSQPSLSRTGRRKDRRSKRGSSMNQISLDQTEKLQRKKQVLASLDSASVISVSSSTGLQRSSSQPSLSSTDRRKDGRSSMDQISLSSAESIGEKELKQEEMQREQEKKPRGKSARAERKASPSAKKYQRSSSDQKIKTEKISLKKEKDKGKDRSPSREEQGPSRPSKESRRSAHSADKISSPGRSGRRSSSSHNKQSSPKSNRRSAGSNHDRSPSREEQGPSRPSKESRRSAHSADKICSPGRSARRSSSSHNKQSSPKSNRRSAGSNHDRSSISQICSSCHDRLTTPTGRRRSSSNHSRLSSSSHDRLTTPTGRRRSSSNHADRLSSSNHADRLTTRTGRRRTSSNHNRLASPAGRLSSSRQDRLTTPTGRRRSSAKDGGSFASKSKKDDVNRLLHSSVESKTSISQSPHSRRGRPLSAPAAVRRPVGIRRKNQVMDLLTILDDKSSHKPDLDTPRRHGSCRGSRIGVAEQSRRAHASATRRNSIEYSLSQIINGSTPEPTPMVNYKYKY